MLFYLARPERAGYFGSNNPKNDNYLSVTMTTYLGGDLIQVESEFICTETFRTVIENAKCSGCHFGSVKATVDDPLGTNQEEFARYGVDVNNALPKYYWLIPTGLPEMDDFGLNSKGYLIVSEGVVALLKQCFLPTCHFIEYMAE